MRYLEIAIGSPLNRGLFIKENELNDYIAKHGEKGAVYRSVYVYPDDIMIHLEKYKSIKGYIGSQDLTFIPIDIDKGENSDEYTQKKLQATLFALEEEGLQRDNCQIYFSGTGYHINIHKGVFGFAESKDLPYLLKETMKTNFDNIDLAVYKRSALYRCVYSKNDKSGLYKIPITWNEAFELPSTKIKELAKTQRLDFLLPEVFGDGELSHLQIKDVPTIRNFTETIEPKTIVPCIQKIYNLGAQEGTRNNAILRLASHFRRSGIPSDAAKAAILHWNDNSLEEDLVMEKVEYVYNSNYKYGCNDWLLKRNCSPRCMYFKRKDYLVDTYNAEDLQKQLEERMVSNWDGRILELNKIFDLAPSIDASIYPGELVTVFGYTGSNKTTLVQNMVLGLNMGTNKIHQNWQIPTLYLTLELSGWVMHRRNLQIVANINKSEVTKHYKSVYAKYKDQLGHIIMQTVAPTIDQIEKKIKELNPSCVIVDYIDLVETPSNIRGEYEQVKYISHKLSSLAVNLDIIIIQLSQVSRSYSRQEILDLYAGKGSGAIENASRKVIGIKGNADTIERQVEMFKNSDGDLFDFKCHWTPSWRLLKE